jgi:hypothetical protein
VPLGPLSKQDAKRIDGLATLLSACRVAFRDVVAATDWLPQPGSPAEKDSLDVASRANAPERADIAITYVIHWLLFSASEQIGGLGALYAQQELFMAPAVMARSIVEHCAHIRWVLGDPAESVDARLARSYLELLRSDEELKKNSGRLLGRSSDQHCLERDRFNNRKQDAAALFGPGITDANGRFELAGQRVPQPEACVEELFTKSSRPITPDLAKGVYGWLSNYSHPTVQVGARLWRVEEREAGPVPVLDARLSDHEDLVRLAVVPFYEVLAYAMTYNGLPMDRYEQLGVEIDEHLPGTLLDPS